MDLMVDVSLLVEYMHSLSQIHTTSPKWV